MSRAENIFTTTGGRYGDKEIVATTRNSVVKGTSKKFTGKELAFYVSAAGSDVQIEEVKVRAYKNVKGKKIYGKAVTVTDILWYND